MSNLIYILNGPNLNLLGAREPEHYGRETLSDIESNCRSAADRLGLRVETMQSNHEGQLVDWIHQARDNAAAIVINPAALSHYSIAILDALNMFDGLVIEVHISQIHQREKFRHHSYVSHRADAVLAGFGGHGYVLALEHLAQKLG